MVDYFKLERIVCVIVGFCVFVFLLRKGKLNMYVNDL